VREIIVTVEMHLETLLAYLMPLEQLLLDTGLARGSQ
jgi:hypothetical protein